MGVFGALWAVVVGIGSAGSTTTGSATPDIHDPTLRGVGLADFGDDTLSAVGRELAAPGSANPLGLSRVVSESLVVAADDRVVVDVVGRKAGLASLDAAAKDGLEVVRVEVPVGAGDDRSELGRPGVVRETPLAAMSPTLTVSIGDHLAILDDEATGFRRVFPVGVGAVDRVRAPGYVASLTPSTDDGLLDKTTALYALGSWNRGQPYMPVSLPAQWHNADGSVHRYHYATPVAFHAWPGTRGFFRGYSSRGCVTLRDPDLGELSAILHALSGSLPLHMHAAPTSAAHHPFPRADRSYWEVEGKAGKARVVGLLYAVDKEAGAPPAHDALVDIYSDSERPHDRVVVPAQMLAASAR